MNEILKQEIEHKYGACKKWLRVKEVSFVYGISVSTVWLYAKKGLITPKKISKRVAVFNIKELDELFSNGIVKQ